MIQVMETIRNNNVLKGRWCSHWQPAMIPKSVWQETRRFNSWDITVSFLGTTQGLRKGWQGKKCILS